MKKLFNIRVDLLLLLILSFSSSVMSQSPVLQSGNLKVLDVQFEPVQQGKNVVYIKLQNTTKEKMVFEINVYSRSPEYGSGIGWGRTLTVNLETDNTKWIRFPFQIYGPITDNTFVRLTFEDLGPAKSSNEKENTTEITWTGQIKYFGVDLPQKDSGPENPISVSGAQKEIVTQQFYDFQNYISKKDYHNAWQFFSNDYQYVMFYDKFERFRKAMAPNTIESMFFWSSVELASLKPESVRMENCSIVLYAANNSITWSVHFVNVDGQFKIDWINGYEPQSVKWANWQERLLPEMQKYVGENFDIYYYKDSTAEKEVNQIAKKREQGYKMICELIRAKDQSRICLVLFENENLKYHETGHQGTGWAFDDTIVEVYNEKTKLDPYHEAVHILMQQYGNPPALFTEGFAVYVSELLGASALEYLGGGTYSLYEKVQLLINENAWIAIEDLFKYTEIGSIESQPQISYSLAGAFVKFIVENYGMEAFLRAYKEIINSDNQAVQNRNLQILTEIYGKTLSDLGTDFKKSVLTGQQGP